MHVHLFNGNHLKETWLLLLVLNGVTTVRDMNGEPEKLELREQINNNQILGPTLYQADGGDAAGRRVLDIYRGSRS